MAINKGIIQVRRGLKEDLQYDKLLPGELAIATDAPCMWFCWSPGNVEQLPTSDNVIDVIIETVNQYLANNDITVISDGFMRVYDGWIQYSADNKTWKNVIAVSELIGENGGYYTPAVTDNGDLTWTPSSAGMEPLPSVNIRGPEAELTKESVENALGYAPLKSADVVDNLVSTATNLPLSAKQGNVLDEKISELNTNTVKVEEKTLTALDSGLCEIGTYANLINVLPPTADQLVLLTHSNKYVRILTRNTDNTFSLIGKGTSVKLKIFYI